MTNTEKKIYDLLILGKSYIEIAEKLNMKLGTVKTHIRNIYLKNNVNKKEELIIKHMRES